MGCGGHASILFIRTSRLISFRPYPKILFLVQFQRSRAKAHMNKFILEINICIKTARPSSLRDDACTVTRPQKRSTSPPLSGWGSYDRRRQKGMMTTRHLMSRHVTIRQLVEPSTWSPMVWPRLYASFTKSSHHQRPTITRKRYHKEACVVF